MKRKVPLQSSFQIQVFINCPFDGKYHPLFDALIFTILDLGFFPRCAKEINDSGQIRIQKILDIIRQCRFGIHDLSRTELSEASGLPRFNMPLELGIFIGAKEFGDRKQKKKVWLILEKEDYRYQRFLSDLAGYDIESHKDSVDRLISVVRRWLSHYSKELLPGEAKIKERYERFLKQLPYYFADNHILDPNYIEFRNYAGKWILETANQ